MRQTFRIFALALPLLALRARPASAQSYGLGDQVLAVGAPEFRPLATGVAYSFGASDLYLYGGTNTFVAPLTLPDGAEIFQICVYANVPDPSSGVSLQLVAGKLAPGGEQPGVVYDPETFAVDNIAIGYGTVCTETFSYIFHETADVDGDGIPEHVFHVLYAIVQENAGIGGGRVFWRRQVSAPPVTADFGDVPTSSPQFQFIEALHAAGITAGCGGGNYCPNDPVTRGQMAIFLAKALGLNWTE